MTIPPNILQFIGHPMSVNETRSFHNTVKMHGFQCYLGLKVQASDPDWLRDRSFLWSTVNVVPGVGKHIIYAFRFQHQPRFRSP